VNQEQTGTNDFTVDTDTDRHTSNTETLSLDKQDRSNREQDSREANTRPSDSWVPPSQLPMPNPEDGWKHRYIRTASLGQPDMRNVSRRFREGWVPIVAKDYPELEVTSDMDSRWPDGVEIGGLLLCKIPAEIANQRNKHFEDTAIQQLKSVDHGFMNDQNPVMPKYNESKSRTQFGKG